MEIPGAVPANLEDDPGLYAHYADALGKAMAWKEEQQLSERDGLESGFARWRRHYKRLHGDGFVQPLQFITPDDQEEWFFVRQFNEGEFQLVGSVYSHLGYSWEEMTTTEAQNAFYIALLYVGMCDDGEGKTSLLLTVKEAEEFYQARGPYAVPIVRGCLNALFRLNDFGFDEDVSKKAAAALLTA